MGLPDVDFLAVVSRPDFPSGMGPVGDYFNLRSFIGRHPEWRSVVLELNSPTTQVDWSDGRFLVRTGSSGWFDVSDVRTALFIPICLEVEETVLGCPATTGRWPHFAAQQWRPISAAFEASLDSLSFPQRCLNHPAAVRMTNNKLLQFQTLSAAGFKLPATRVLGRFPETGLFADADQLVSKNVSEGGWRSPTEFSPARIVGRGEQGEVWPTMWQQPIEGDTEIRCYVTGDDVTVVELCKEAGVLDVRSAHGGRPAGTIVEISESWAQSLVAMTRCLGLDYAVIDAIPTGDVLQVLEVNANGVWWFLPTDVGQVLEDKFHRWIEAAVNEA